MSNDPRILDRRRGLAALAGFVFLALTASPGSAGSSHKETGAPGDLAPGKAKYSGDINPTNVAIVETDLCRSAPPAVPPEEQTWASDANAYATGAGVVVAVLDGGFNLAHPDLAGHLTRDGWDCVDNDPNPNDLGNGIDDDRDGIADRGVGHGTFVAGMVLKIAPGAMILPVRVRNDEGHGSNQQVASGIVYAMGHGATVINLSLEVTDIADACVRAQLATAARRGISIVVSAGNDSAGTLTTLSGISGGISAGAVDSQDRVAAFSNCTDASPVPGAARLVFAPGVDLYGPIGSPTTDARGVWSGTSFSAGLLSGAVAVVRQARPWLSASQITDCIAGTVDPVTDRSGNTLRWSGRVNLLRAVGK